MRLIAIICLCATVATASEERVSLTCGPYCMYTALKYCNKDVEPLDLLRPEYLTGANGSTLGDLVRTANDFGLHASPFEHITPRALLHCPYPVIVSVRSKPSAPSPDHYWVVLPQEGRPSQIVDAMHGAVVPSTELYRGYWSGIGLVLSTEPVRPVSIFAKDYVILAGLCLAGFAGRGLLRRRKRRRVEGSGTGTSLTMIVARGLLIVLLSIAAGFAYHSATRAGSFLNDAQMVDEIQNRHLASLLPKVTVEEVGQAREKGAIVVDARMAQDYNIDHVPDAVNLPPDSTAEKCAQALGEYAQTTPIIIYC